MWLECILFGDVKAMRTFRHHIERITAKMKFEGSKISSILSSFVAMLRFSNFLRVSSCVKANARNYLYMGEKFEYLTV